MLLKESFPVDRQRHQVFDTDPILGSLGLDGVADDWRPSLPRSLAAAGEQALTWAGLSGSTLIGLAPAAVWGVSKIWPAACYGLLARSLVEDGLQPVIPVGPGEEAMAAAVTEAAAIDPPVVGPEVDIAGLAGVMSHLAVSACNDTGPMHLAAMAGSRVVALFRPTDPQRTAPLGQRHVVLTRDLECAPCFQPRCPLKHNECLRNLPSEEVARAIRSLVDSS